ncbi:MAG TPA: pyruvate formate-lyase-activating protein [Kiritimatiellia bacterium]|nr:pyruvate formate-lyase-activating protein [Kiritimatiellia bacterium]
MTSPATTCPCGAEPRGKAAERPVVSADRGYVHSVESAGTVDGPGVRFILFLSGCPLRCLYCHNPDTWRMRGGRLRTVAEVLEEIEGYADFIRRARGGVTISGGEPLMQPRFLQALLEGLKARGMHTALDTSGALGHMVSDGLLNLVDLFLLDLKAGTEEEHRSLTGAPLAPMLTFARRVEGLGRPVWFRHVLVPGLTDGEDSLRAVARHIAGFTNVERVELLAFHQMATHKWQGLGRAYRLETTRPATDADVARAKAIFAEEGVRAEG